MTAPARRHLTKLLLGVGIAVAGLATACATAPRGSAAAPVATACGTGRAEWADPFCGARLREPAAVLCALSGYTARPAFLLNSAALAAPLPDASMIHAKLTEDSATFEAVIQDVIDPPPPCAMEVLALTREWPPLTDARRSVDRYTAIASQLDTGFPDATSRCRVQTDLSGWRLVRELITPQRVVTREFGSFRSSDAVEEKKRVATENFLRTLKITLDWPSGQSRDTSTVRQRYAMAIDMRPWGPYLTRDSIGIETGTAACDRLERQTLERVRREAH